MKRGYRKLCDIHCHLAHAVEMREDVEKHLTAQGIPFVVASWADEEDRDFWRINVPGDQVSAARAGVALTLRGFRAVSERA